MSTCESTAMAVLNGAVVPRLITCDKPGVIKQNGLWWCVEHWNELFGEPDRQNESSE